ncbi:hypothetical protein NDU88_006479 [Pleurodeles waltl]|uniref:Uncharacterized protein n=1 Tax=Pleurodeles waltl TaxID=8319 RepID=A0AAV7MDJ0_PLEWA|nr:hypothetical protein NDU88_006479 [Pleurodeles waltl]
MCARSTARANAAVNRPTTPKRKANQNCTIDETVHANARRRHNAEAISFHTAFKMCRSSTGSLSTGQARPWGDLFLFQTIDETVHANAVSDCNFPFIHAMR